MPVEIYDEVKRILGDKPQVERQAPSLSATKGIN